MKELILLILTSALLLSRPCDADTDSPFSVMCSPSNESASQRELPDNLNNLLNSLAANGSLHGGFYTTSVGKGSNKVYGLVQCRDDISPIECSNCTRNAMSMAFEACGSKVKRASAWRNWCFLRFSNETFFGKMDDSSSMEVFYGTDYEDPSVVPRELAFMGDIVSSAPNQPSMFFTSVLDVGASGKRYGMAQCTRDISRSDCGKCLDGLLVAFSVTNKRWWAIFRSSCRLWYHDFQFYNSNTSLSTATSRGDRIAMNLGTAVAIIMISILTGSFSFIID